MIFDSFGSYIYHDAVTAPVAAVSNWATTGLSVILPIDGVYDVRLMLFEEIDAQGNQAIQFATRLMRDGMQEGPEHHFCVAAVSGDYRATHQIGIMHEARAGIHTIELVMISNGSVAILPPSALTIHGPLQRLPL